jgi:hypothetical protein
VTPRQKAFHQEIADNIRANANFHMAKWGNEDGSMPKCGTAMCMAGTIVALRPDVLGEDVGTDVGLAADRIYEHVTGEACALDFCAWKTYKSLHEITAEDAAQYLETGSWPE